MYNSSMLYNDFLAPHAHLLNPTCTIEARVIRTTSQWSSDLVQRGGGDNLNSCDLTGSRPLELGRNEQT